MSIDWRRPFRYVIRVPLLVLHLVLSLPLTLLTINALGARIRLRHGESLEHRMIRWWQGSLMRVFGFRLVKHGESLPGAVLLVANHLSWLDITLIHSQRMACFVAKSEIARWPLVGWLAGRGGTIYHKRGSNESLASVAQMMVDRLQQGLAVAVFPEGGTGPGDHVRTFHARIFQAAIDAQVPVQPVALRFSRNGVLTTDISFRDNENFLVNFLRVLGEPGTDAEVLFLEPIAPSNERRRLAEASRSRIVEALGFEDRKRRERAGGAATDTSIAGAPANAVALDAVASELASSDLPADHGSRAAGQSEIPNATAATELATTGSDARD
jgi:1-acyl-sn-glycerol-3-phosphate acyltransferase